MNEQVIAKMMSKMMFNNYLSDINGSKPYNLVLRKKDAFNMGTSHDVKLIMIGDLVKWCSLKKGSCMN